MSDGRPPRLDPSPAEYPVTRDARGPHGIPLLAHAQQGEHARRVVELLEGAGAPTPAA